MPHIHSAVQHLWHIVSQVSLSLPKRKKKIIFFLVRPRTFWHALTRPKLIKQFVKALNTKAKAFIFTANVFLRLSKGKLKDSIFIKPEKVLPSQEFEAKMAWKEQNALETWVKISFGLTKVRIKGSWLNW